MNAENVKTVLTEADAAGLLPDLEHMFDQLAVVLRIAVMIGPLLLLGLGLLYLLASPKEANHSLGYRFYWGMSSVEVWQFTQRIAGIAWTVLGLVMSVVMSVICNGFPELARDVMIFTAMKAILWQLALVVISIVGINTAIVVLYDRKGYRRRRNRR